jgi:hypothetical protein
MKQSAEAILPSGREFRGEVSAECRMQNDFEAKNEAGCRGHSALCTLPSALPQNSGGRT